MSTLNWSEISRRHMHFLRKEVIPFWETLSPDNEHGGYFTCINGDHEVYDTDKFVWLQARESWMFAKFANELAVNEEEKSRWVALSHLGAVFLRDKCRDMSSPHKDFYFSVSRDGTPQVAPFSIFSDCFSCIAFAQYAKATEEAWARELCWDRFLRIDARRANPVGQWGKGIEGASRGFRPLNVSMIDINTCQELLSTALFPTDEIHQRIKKNVGIIMSHISPEHNTFLENVAAKPEDQDTHEGRLLCPGHSLECCWFLLATDADLLGAGVATRVLSIIKSTLELGWDTEFGGLLYFIDAKGKPLQQLEWDQKLWWVHQEALLACLYAFQISHDVFFSEWFVRLETYIFEKFVDAKKGGDIFGYLRRDGTVLLNLKGGKWKGFFHSPRAFFLTARIAGELSKSLPLS